MTGEAEFLRDVFDELPVPVVVLDGPEGRLLATNRAFKTFADREMALGQAVGTLLPGDRVAASAYRVYTSGVAEELRGWRFPRTVDGVTSSLMDLVLLPRRGPGGQVLGVTVVFVDVTELAGRTSQAHVAYERYEQAAETLKELQRKLLPSGVAVLPSAQVAACSLPAAGPLGADVNGGAGGDWFDSVVVADGRLALMVGDVAAHGATASVTMGQLRAVLRDRLAETGDIGTALAAADRIAGTVLAARATTVCVAVLDPRDGSVVYCTAGHPPPLLITADGKPRYLRTTGSGPLSADHPYRTGREWLAEGDTLLLYTDGILERPGRDHRRGIRELAGAVRETATRRAPDEPDLRRAERTCTRTVETLVGETGHTDDITLLAVQRVAPPPPLTLELTAASGVIRRVRGELSAWLTRLGVSRSDVAALQHAVGELVTNVADHAYRDSEDPGPIRVRATLETDGAVRVEVSDRGQWYDHAPGVSSRQGGLGLVLAEFVVDSLHLDHDAAGTTATVRHRVNGPVRLLSATDLPGPIMPAVLEPQLLLILDQPALPPPAIRVDGPVDRLTARELAKELQRLTRNGTRPLTADLTGVTVLSSDGVAVLQHAVQLSREHGTDLCLYAPAGTTADHVLTLVALSHMVEPPL
jgi:serine phosphatase RsbU (regulator of sigma subunit)/anti-sigma regulatory factor (Ser/Thr protein kinase)/anti-anti-sigma regulatory factor